MKTLLKSLPILVIGIFYLQACAPPEVTISIKNELNFERTETISVSTEQISKTGSTDLNSLEILDKSGTPLLTQVTADNKLLFQAKVGANEETTFNVRVKTSDKTVNSDISTFSRIVPERVDDYAWENDKVAFRTYGPEGQRQAEANVPGATTSSGMDCWLKKVDYPVIDKWYKKYVDGGSYHKDDGEGLDNYHVGASRGCGGIGIFVNDTLYTSKNFQKWNTIDQGPIQSNFTLTYDPWEANGLMVSEEKKITLDLGSNLMKVEVTLNANEPIDLTTVGIAIHDSTATASSNKKSGWFGVWSPHHGSELGTAVVMTPSQVSDSKDFRTNEKDMSHLLIHARTNNSKLTYYTGFTWMESGQFDNQQAWEAYLEQFTQRLASPLNVSIK